MAETKPMSLLEMGLAKSKKVAEQRKKTTSTTPTSGQSAATATQPVVEKRGETPEERATYARLMGLNDLGASGMALELSKMDSAKEQMNKSAANVAKLQSKMKPQEHDPRKVDAQRIMQQNITQRAAQKMADEPTSVEGVEDKSKATAKYFGFEPYILKPDVQSRKTMRDVFDSTDPLYESQGLAAAFKYIDTLPTNEEGKIVVNGVPYSRMELAQGLAPQIVSANSGSLFANNATYRDDMAKRMGYKNMDSYLAALDQRLAAMQRDLANHVSAQHAIQTPFNDMAGLEALATQERAGAKVIRDLRDQIKSMRAGEGGFEQFFKGLNEGFDAVNMATLGIADLASEYKQNIVFNKMLNGETLTPEERILADALNIKSDLDSLREAQGQSWYNNIGAGVGYVGEIAPQFAGPMLAAKGLFKTINVGAKGAWEMTKKAASKGFTNALKTGLGATARVGGKSLNNIARFQINGMLTAPLQASTYSRFLEKRNAQYSIKDGKVTYTPTDAWRDLVDTWIEQGAEVGSELFGVSLEKFTSASLAAIGRNIGLGKMMRKIGGSVRDVETSKAMRFVKSGATKAGQQLFGYAGGVLPETLSEIYGDLTSEMFKSVLTGNGNFEEFKNPTYWATAFALSGIYGGAMSVLPSMADYASYMRDISALGNIKKKILSDGKIEHADLKNALIALSAGGSIKDATGHLAELEWKNGGYSLEEIGYAMDYIRAEAMQQVRMGEATESQRLQRFGNVAQNIEAHAYRDEDGMPSGSMVMAVDKDGNSYHILEGDYSNKEATLKALNSEGKVVPLLASNIEGLSKASIADVTLFYYQQMFSTEFNMQRLESVEYAIERMDNPTMAQVADVAKRVGIVIPKEGDTITLVDGRTAKVTSISDDLGIMAEMTDGEGNISQVTIPIMQILSSNTYIAEAQKLQNAEDALELAQAEEAQAEAEDAVEEGDATAEVATEEASNGIIGTEVTLPNGNKGTIVEVDGDDVIVDTGRGVDAYEVYSKEELGMTEAAETTTPQPTHTATEQTTGEVTPEQATEALNEIADIKPVPTLEDGSIDYDAIDDAETFAKYFEHDMGGREEAIKSVQEMREQAVADLAEAEKKGKKARSANEKVANKAERQRLAERIAFYDNVLDIYTPKAETPATPIESAPQVDTTPSQTEAQSSVEAIEGVQPSETTAEEQVDGYSKYNEKLERRVGLQHNELSERLEEKTRRMINDVATAFGVEVIFQREVRSNAGNLVNGKIDGSTVYFNWGRREHTLTWLMGHEFTHRMKALSPEAYKKLRDAVRVHLGEGKWNRLIEKQRKIYEERENPEEILTSAESAAIWEEAKEQTKREDGSFDEEAAKKLYNKKVTEARREAYIEEVVCDEVGVLARDHKAFDRFLRSEHVRNDGKLLSWLRKVWQSLKNAFIRDARTFNKVMKTLDELINASTAEVAKGVEPTEGGEKKSLSAPVFYSNAQYAVQNIKQEKATPEQWLKMIEKNGGLKAGEDKWLGLSDWLKDSDKKTLTKDEVLQYIAENDIQIEEVSYGEPEYISENEIYESDAFSTLVASLTDYDEDDNPYINQEQYKELQNADPNFLDGFSLDYWGEGLDIDDKMAAARYLGLLDVDNEINNTRLQYTTQGLTKKKEIALVVPTIEPYNQSDEIHFGDAGDGRAVAWVRFGDAEAQRSEEVVRRVDEFEAPYKDVNGHEIYRPKDRLYAKDFISYGKLKSGEYAYVVYVNDKQIPVAHKSLEDARNALNEHYKANPEKRTRWDKVLVIDEIQSKRHQDGREKGYRDESELVRLEEAKEALREATREFGEYRDALKEKYDYNSIEGSPVTRARAFLAMMTEQERAKFEELNNKVREAEMIQAVAREPQLRMEDIIFTESDGIIEGRYGDLTARFVEGTSREAIRQDLQGQMRQQRINDVTKRVPVAPFEKNWAELAFKRMLRYAAENGYDYVAWTTGDQQADRYDIGSVVKDIVTYDTKDADGNPIKKMKFRMNNMGTYNIATNVEGVIVKGDGEMKEGMRLSDITGKALAEKIMNGEGEDAMVFENGKDIEAKSLEGEELHIGNEGMKAFYDQMLPSFVKKYTKKWGAEVGEVTMPDLAENNTMHAVNVTDSMRESVMQGQPKYSLQEVNNRFNEELATLTEENKDKVILSLGIPSEKLLAGGVVNKPMKLYGAKVIKKQKLHGFDLSEIKNLPLAVANPIAVFNNYQSDENRSVLTELTTKDGNFLVSLNVGKGEDIDFNIVATVFGKGDDNIVDWFNRGLATYIDKEKALDYLHHSALNAEALSNPRLISTTNIIQNFQNPKIEAKNSLITPEMDASYLDAVERGDMETAQKMVDDMAKKFGYTIRGEHGTTHKFTIFNYDYANKENSFGEGHYFTSDYDDAQDNYSSEEGADLKQRIELLAERMENDPEYEDMSDEERLRIATQKLSGGENIVISAALRMDNPVVFGEDADGEIQETYFDFTESYDEDIDEYGEPEGALIDFVDALNDELSSGDYWGTESVDLWEITEGDGIYANELRDKVIGLLSDTQDNDGNFVSNNIFRNALARMGFDGIIDNEPSIRFSNMGLSRFTKHYIVFDSNQIKLTDPVTYDDNGNIIPLSERFNPRKEDIRYSLQTFDDKVQMITYEVRHLGIQSSVMVAENTSEFISILKDMGDDDPESYKKCGGIYLGDIETIVINGDHMDNFMRSAQILIHENTHSITKTLRPKLHGVLSGLNEEDILAYRDEKFSEIYKNDTAIDVLDEIISYFVGDIPYNKLIDFYQGVLEVEDIILSDFGIRASIDERYWPIYRAIMPIIAENITIQKEYYNGEKKNGIVIAREFYPKNGRENEESRRGIDINQIEGHRPIEGNEQGGVLQKVGAQEDQSVAPTRYSLQSGDMPFFDDNGDIITFDNTDITGEDYDAVELRSPMPTTPRTTEDVIKAHLSARHNAAKERIRRESRVLRDAVRKQYREEQVRRREGVESMRTNAAKVDYIIGAPIETLDYEAQVLAMIAMGTLSISWESLSKELGVKSGDKKSYRHITNGTTATLDAVVHAWWESINGYENGIDTQDLRNALIDVLMQVPTAKGALSILEDRFDHALRNRDEALEDIDREEDRLIAEEDARYNEQMTTLSDPVRMSEYVRQYEQTIGFHEELTAIEGTLRKMDSELKAVRKRAERAQMRNKASKQKQFDKSKEIIGKQKEFYKDKLAEQRASFKEVREAIAESKRALLEALSTYEQLGFNKQEVRSLVDAVNKARSMADINKVRVKIENVILNVSIREKRRHMDQMLNLRLPSGELVETWVSKQIHDGKMSVADGKRILADMFRGTNATGVRVAKYVDDETARVMDYLRKNLIVPNHGAHYEEKKDADGNVIGREYVPSREAEMGANVLMQANNERCNELLGKAVEGTITEEEKIELQARQLYEPYLFVANARAYVKEVRAEGEKMYEDIQRKKAELGDAYTKEERDADYAALEANALHLVEAKTAYDDALTEYNETLSNVIMSGRDKLREFREAKEAHKTKVVNMAIRAIGGEARTIASQPTVAEKVAAWNRTAFHSTYWTFDSACREIDRFAPNGEGEFYKHFMGGMTKASNDFFTRTDNHVQDICDAVRRITGSKRDPRRALRAFMRKADMTTVSSITYKNDNGKMEPLPLRISNALFTLAMWGQAQYREIMEKHGITKEQMEALQTKIERIDGRYIDFMEWVIDSFLPSTRLEYNEVHKQLFGASMDNIKNYFPAKVVEGYRDEDIAKEDTGLPSTMTGSIITRQKHNNMPQFDQSFFSVLLNHIQNMDQWASFSPLVEDLNAVISNPEFKRLVNTHMAGVNNDRSGEGSLWQIFKDTSAVAIGSYRCKTPVVDRMISKFTGAWAASNISWRFSTALKQLSGLTAVAVSGFGKTQGMFLKNMMLSPLAVKWAMENSPMLQKRFGDRFAGNEVLMRKYGQDQANGVDLRKGKLKDGLERVNDFIRFLTVDVGMTPNAAVDALVVAITMKTVYDVELSNLTKGKPETATEEQKSYAMMKAEIFANETQQSAEGAYLSVPQAQRSVMTAVMTTYLNASFASHRLRVQGVQDIYRWLSPKYRKEIDDRYGKGAARKAAGKGLARLLSGISIDATFILMSRAVGQGLWRLIIDWFDDTEDNDDEADPIDWSDIGWEIGFQTAFGGMLGGNIITTLRNGYKPSLMPALEELKRLGYDLLGWTEAKIKNGDWSIDLNFWALGEIIFKYGYGLDPETMLNIARGIEGICRDKDPMAAMKILNTPQSMVNIIAGPRRDNETVKEYVERRARLEVLFAQPKYSELYDDEGKFIGKGKYDVVGGAKDYRLKDLFKEYNERQRAAVMSKYLSPSEVAEFERIDSEYKAIVESLGWEVGKNPVDDMVDKTTKKYKYPNGLIDVHYAALKKIATEAERTRRAQDRWVGTDMGFADLIRTEYSLRSEVIKGRKSVRSAKTAKEKIDRAEKQRKKNQKK